jgi:hypothetical protein
VRQRNIWLCLFLLCRYSFKELRDVVTNIEAAKAVKQHGQAGHADGHGHGHGHGAAEVAVDMKILRYAMHEVRPQAAAAEIARFEEFADGYAVLASGAPDFL